MSSRPEAELIAGCRQGDAQAWDELFDRHYAATGRFVFQLGHDFTREDAADDLLLNEVIWRSVRGPDSPMPPPVRAAFVFPK